MSERFSRFIVGAYAASPSGAGWDRARESAFFHGLRKMKGMAGIELPFLGSLHPHDPEWLLETLDPSWDVVLTMIPGVMQKLASDPHFGLASDDEGGRRSALEFTSRAREAVDVLSARVRVRAVEIHSAPTLGISGVSGSAVSFTKSLHEVRSWDWKGAELVVEHCDAYRREQRPVKGFLTLDEELAAIRVSDFEAATPCRVLVNWGRSAIEGRDPRLPLEHAQKAKAAGRFAGMIFSGATVGNALYGDWADSHAPFDAEGSVLSAEVLEKTLRDLAPEEVWGLKMQALPKTLSVEERLAFVERQVEILAGAVY